MAILTSNKINGGDWNIRNVHTWVDPSFFASTWLGTYKGVNRARQGVTDPVGQSDLVPPIIRVRAGRPKKNRYEPREGVKPVRCSRCGKPGHNSLTCREIDPEHVAKRLAPEKIAAAVIDLTQDLESEDK